MLSRALHSHIAADDNAPLERLSEALRELDADLVDRSSGADSAGAFTSLVGSGVQHEHRTDDLGRGLRIAEEAVNPHVEEVHMILPNYAPEYVEALLHSTEYATVERVVEALLEGTALAPEAIQ
ncbi:hypothetical protein BGW80DRAFT_1463764 [Lactifluus volemus]|nr:hypothetical protein BGW80DRAFT_1463764 [Lactifluus volemus]